MNFQTMSNQRKFILITAAIGVISMFLPWLSWPFGGSVNGMHGEGIIVFLCFTVCGVLGFLGDQTKNLSKSSWMLCLILSAIGALILVINFLRVLEVLKAFSIGFYLATIASVALVAVIYIFRSPDDSIKSGFDSLKKDIGDKTKNPPAPPAS